MRRSIPLLPFQHIAVETAERKRRLLLNLPAGSGKSLIALETLRAINYRRALILCPTFLRLNWEYEIRKWYGDKPFVMIIADEDDAIAARRATEGIFIVGYSYFEGRRKIGPIAKRNYDLVICDESHYLRRWESARCRNVIRKVCRRRERVLFMSATPFVTSAADLHPTFSIMQPGKWGKYGAFKERYCLKEHDIYSPGGIRYTGISEHGDELKERAKSFVFTRRKSVILSELPKKQIIDVPLSSDIKFVDFGDDIDDMLTQLADEDESDEIKTERERIGLAKVADVLEFVETIPESEQTVIFTWHKSVNRELVMNLPSSVGAIYGGMTESVRMDIVKRFQDGKFRILVVSIAAGGLGLNLQCASTAIFAELPYSHAEFEQCCDRVHRIGSKKRVLIYKMVAVGSLDEHINKLITKKRDAAETAGVAT